MTTAIVQFTLGPRMRHIPTLRAAVNAPGVDEGRACFVVSRDRTW